MSVQTSKIRVLIVEDQALIAEDIRWQLLKSNFEVTGVIDNGEEALNLAQALKPDLVLMDIQLKGPMSGLEAGRLIGDRVGSAVIYVSANYHGLSALPFISKPFSMLKLSDAMNVLDSPN